MHELDQYVPAVGTSTPVPGSILPASGRYCSSSRTYNAYQGQSGVTSFNMAQRACKIGPLGPYDGP